MRIRMIALLAFALGASACGQPEPSTTGGTVAETHAASPEAQERAWGSSDRPSLMDGNLEYRASRLPRSGQARQTPWAASYWPTYQDSINYRWAGRGTMSPAEKFAKAFNQPGFPDAVSATYGIDSQSHRTRCTMDSQCDRSTGATCAIRDGERAGYCIETWFGICHAWAPAAIMEKEPQHPVTYNGVEFKVNDIKALVTLAYDKGLRTNFMSLRCNKRDGGTGSNGVSYDSYGNSTDPECVDTNPGSFHLVVANLLGLQGRSFVEDRTMDYEVWNQPVRAYRITRYEPLSASQANAALGASGSYYQFNRAAQQFIRVQLELDWIGESHSETDGNLSSSIDRYTNTDTYDYILELDGSSEPRIIGGEWIGASKKNHPDFLWLGTAKGNTSTAGARWTDIERLLDMSTR